MASSPHSDGLSTPPLDDRNKVSAQSNSDGNHHHVYRGRHQSLSPAFHDGLSVSDQGDDSKRGIVDPRDKCEDEEEAALMQLAQEEELLRLANEANARAQQEAIDWQKKHGAAAVIPYDDKTRISPGSNGAYASPPSSSAASPTAASHRRPPPYYDVSRRSSNTLTTTSLPRLNDPAGRAIIEAATAANRAAAAALDPADYPDYESYSKAKWILTANDRTRAHKGTKQRAEERKRLAEREARSRAASSSAAAAAAAAATATATATGARAATPTGPATARRRAQQEAEAAAAGQGQGQRRRRREGDDEGRQYQQHQQQPRPYVGSAYYQWYSAGGNFEQWAAMQRARSEAVWALHAQGRGGGYGQGWWGGGYR